MSTANYTRDEEGQVAEQLRRAQPPTCPRCRRALSRREVPPRAEVAYVRERVWLMCGHCRRSMVLERPTQERPSEGSRRGADDPERTP